MDLCKLSATALVAAYRRRTISPVDVTQAVLDRIAQFNSVVNAFRLVDEERALATATASEARWAGGQPRGLLDGVPTTIKDIVLVEGWPTLRGSRTVNPNGPWHEDAPATARLREHGAVLIGATTTPEFGWKAVTDSPLTGITRNPWNIERTPGGSSGGASAAAALGMGALHVGTDGGGSIRIPSAFTGIFGIKPTFGRVPAYPLSPFGTVAHLGPMTRTVEDAALMLTVMSEPDSRDWYGLPADGRDYRIGLHDGVAGLRIAYSPDLGFATVDGEIAAAVRRVADALSDLGADVEEANPGFDDPIGIFEAHWYGGAALVVDGIDEDQRGLVDPGLLEIAGEATAYPPLRVYEAVKSRGALGARMSAFHERYDLLLTPSVPIPAFGAGHEVPPGSGLPRWLRWAPFSYPFNLTQQPACSFPCGFTEDGLPIGAQIVAAKYEDALVLQAARALETAMPIVLPDAPRGVAAGA